MEKSRNFAAELDLSRLNNSNKDSIEGLPMSDVSIGAKAEKARTNKAASKVFFGVDVFRKNCLRSGGSNCDKVSYWLRVMNY